MVTDYFIQIEVEIENGILSPEQIKEAGKKLPAEYKAKSNDPEIRIDGDIAKILFRCTKKGKSTHIVASGGNSPSKNSY